MPAALIAPARPHVRHKKIPASRFHAQRGRITVGAPVALGNDEIEEDRGGDSTKDEEANEDDREQNRVSQSESLLHEGPSFHMCDTIFDAFDAHILPDRERVVAKVASPHG